MSGDDPSLLVVTGGIASELENLSGQVFHNGCEVDGSTSTDALGIVAFTQKTVDPSNGELEPSTSVCVSTATRMKIWNSIQWKRKGKRWTRGGSREDKRVNLK